MIRRRLAPRLLAASLVLYAARLAYSEPTVGVYYYPWYGSFTGGHSLNQSLRGHLVPAQPPAIGYYDNRNSANIASHIDQSHRGNIDFWAVSWWGPSSAENTTFRGSILAHPRASELKYAVHYESTGRLGTFAAPNYSNLIPDFRYLALNYFPNPNYLRIDDRPVVFMYVTRAYFNTQTARDAVASLRATMQSEFGINPYIVGDDVFGGDVNLQRAQLWDAITDFDVYGTSLQSAGPNSAALTNLAGVYDNARAVIANTNVGFIPTASPGFNDTGVRTGHPPAPRYMLDDQTSTEGLLFKRMLNEVAVPRVDPKADNILMINSFNEWHEDTQIEPTIIAPRTNVDNSTDQRYAQGYYYQGYGDLYLNMLRAATTIAGDYNFNGVVDAADFIVWRNSFNQAGVDLAADGNHNNKIDTGDYDVWRAHFGQTAASGAGVAGLNEAVPEPAANLAPLIGMLVFAGSAKRFLRSSSVAK
jgi:glycoprotein endo-alpha-1,2-mannosidase